MRSISQHAKRLSVGITISRRITYLLMWFFRSKSCRAYGRSARGSVMLACRTRYMGLSGKFTNV